MSSRLEEAHKKREERGHIHHEMKKLLEEVKEKQDGKLTPEQRTQFDKWHEACDTLEKEAKELEADAKRFGLLEEGALEEISKEHDFHAKKKNLPTRADYDLAFRGQLLYGTAYFTEPMARALQKCGEKPMAGGKVEMRFGGYKPLFNLTNPYDGVEAGINRRSMSAMQKYAQDLVHTRATVAQAIGNSSGGGNVVQNEVMAAFQVATLAGGAMRQAATIWPTETGATKQFPGTLDTIKGAILAENTAAVTEDITFTQQTLAADKYTTNMVKLPMELIQDASFDIAGWVGANLGGRIRRITEEYWATGEASGSEPEGLVTTGSSGGASVGATQSSEANITHNDLTNLEHYVDPDYRQSSQYMFHDSVLKNLRQQLDGNNRPLWQPSMTSDVPDSINGYPYFINQEYGSFAGTSANATKLMTFGPHQHYVIRDVVGRTEGFSAMVLRERFAELAQIAFVGFSRHDGQYIHPTAGTTDATLRYMAAATS